MKNKVVFSVLIPCHGILPFLDECIDSILKQNFIDGFEIILVNQSADQEIIINQQKKAPEIIKIVVTETLGISHALNAGLKECKSDWIMRMDSDDVMLPNRMKIQLDEIMKRSDIVVLGGQATKINFKGEIIGDIRYPKSSILNKYFLKYTSTLAHPGVVINKEKLNKIGGYSSIFPHAEDFYAWNQLKNVGLIRNSKSKVIEYRMSDNQISAKNSREQRLSKARIILSLKSELAEPNNVKNFASLLEILETTPTDIHRIGVTILEMNKRMAVFSCKYVFNRILYKMALKLGL